MTTAPPLDTGSMNFAELRRSGCYYVDKTQHFGEVLGASRGPLLLTRPRRFGKTLTQYTLRSFLELNYEHPGSPNADAELFEGLAVSEDAALCAQYQGQFPVIFLTLKDLQCQTFGAACQELCGRIAALYNEFDFLAAASQLKALQRRNFETCMQLPDLDPGSRREELLGVSLLLLAQCLHAVYRRSAYILIDEYDVPLLWAAHYSGAGERDYYESLRVLLFGMLGRVVKTGDAAVRRSIMTGCLRLNPPGSISGINNLRVLGMHSSSCATLMGFTDGEVDQLLADYDLTSRRASIRDWYDGYVCGRSRLYNPWSVINYCADLRDDPQCEPRNYRVESSSNDFRRYFITELSAGSMAAMQRLLDGQSVTMELRHGLDYPDPDAAEYDDRSFFTLLYQAGYLTRAQPDPRDDEGTERYVIPNCEVLDCFRVKVHDYYTQRAVQTNPRFAAIIEAFLTGSHLLVQQGLRRLYSHYLDMQAAAGRLRSRRRHDAASPAPEGTTLQDQEGAARRRGERELGYQTLCMGMLTLFDGAALAVLRMEQVLGSGRTDISFAGLEVCPAAACLLEFKVAPGEDDEDLDEAAAQGLRQTRDNGCAQALLEGNPSLQVIYSYGIGCRAKACRVQMEVIRRGAP